MNPAGPSKPLAAGRNKTLARLPEDDDEISDLTEDDDDDKPLCDDPILPAAKTSLGKRDRAASPVARQEEPARPARRTVRT